MKEPWRCGLWTAILFSSYFLTPTDAQFVLMDPVNGTSPFTLNMTETCGESFTKFAFVPINAKENHEVGRLVDFDGGPGWGPFRIVSGNEKALFKIDNEGTIRVAFPFFDHEMEEFRIRLASMNDILVCTVQINIRVSANSSALAASNLGVNQTFEDNEAVRPESTFPTPTKPLIPTTTPTITTTTATTTSTTTTPLATTTTSTTTPSSFGLPLANILQSKPNNRDLFADSPFDLDKTAGRNSTKRQGAFGQGGGTFPLGPRCADPFLTVAVPADTPPNTFITKVTATHQIGVPVVYTIPDVVFDRFRIDAVTGQIFTGPAALSTRIRPFSPAGLVRQTRSALEFRARASVPNNMYCETVIRVNIVPTSYQANPTSPTGGGGGTPPQFVTQFLNFPVTICQPGVVIGQVEARDVDPGDRIQYIIDNPNSEIIVDSNTGVLRVANLVGPQQQHVRQIIVRAIDTTGLSSTVLVTVNLLCSGGGGGGGTGMLQFSQPSYRFFMSNCNPGVPVGQINVLGNPPGVIFQITNSREFVIEPNGNGGIIRLVAPIGNANLQRTFTVSAVDMQGNRGQVPVTVDIQCASGGSNGLFPGPSLPVEPQDQFLMRGPPGSPIFNGPNPGDFNPGQPPGSPNFNAPVNPGPNFIGSGPGSFLPGPPGSPNPGNFNPDNTNLIPSNPGNFNPGPPGGPNIFGLNPGGFNPGPSGNTNFMGPNTGFDPSGPRPPQDPGNPMNFPPPNVSQFPIVPPNFAGPNFPGMGNNMPNLPPNGPNFGNLPPNFQPNSPGMGNPGLPNLPGPDPNSFRDPLFRPQFPNRQLTIFETQNGNIPNRQLEIFDTQNGNPQLEGNPGRFFFDQIPGQEASSFPGGGNLHAFLDLTIRDHNTNNENKNIDPASRLQPFEDSSRFQSDDGSKQTSNTNTEKSAKNKNKQTSADDAQFPEDPNPNPQTNFDHTHRQFQLNSNPGSPLVLGFQNQILLRPQNQQQQQQPPQPNQFPLPNDPQNRLLMQPFPMQFVSPQNQPPLFGPRNQFPPPPFNQMPPFDGMNRPPFGMQQPNQIQIGPNILPPFAVVEKSPGNMNNGQIPGRISDDLPPFLGPNAISVDGFLNQPPMFMDRRPMQLPPPQFPISIQSNLNIPFDGRFTELTMRLPQSAGQTPPIFVSPLCAPPNSNFIGRVKAIDPDPTDRVSYFIYSTGGTDIFDVNTNTGEIRTRVALGTGTYSLDVAARDMTGRTAIMKLEISISPGCLQPRMGGPQNDEPVVPAELVSTSGLSPSFTQMNYQFSLPSVTIRRTVLGQVHATSSTGEPVRYTLSPSGNFEIGFDGKIFTSSDRPHPQHLIVTATDLGGHTASANIHIVATTNTNNKALSLGQPEAAFCADDFVPTALSNGGLSSMFPPSIKHFGIIRQLSKSGLSIRGPTVITVDAPYAGILPATLPLGSALAEYQVSGGSGTYRWLTDDDGRFEISGESNGILQTKTPLQPGAYEYSGTVKDNVGNMATLNIRVIVRNPDFAENILAVSPEMPSLRNPQELDRELPALF